MDEIEARARAIAEWEANQRFGPTQAFSTPSFGPAPTSVYDNISEFAPVASPSRFSTEGLASAAGSGLKSLYRGSVRGGVSLPAMIADLVMTALPTSKEFSPEIFHGFSYDPQTGVKMPITERALKLSEYITPESTGSPLEIVGEFISPGLFSKAAQKIGTKVFEKTPAALEFLSKLFYHPVVDTAAGFGAVAGQKMAERVESPIGKAALTLGVPALTGGAAGMVGELAGATGQFAKSTVKSVQKTPLEELRARAGVILREATGLDPEIIAAAVNRAPESKLKKFMTTAELTQNAGMANVEQWARGNLAKESQEALKARIDAREKLLKGTTKAGAVDDEKLAADVVAKAKSTKQSRKDAYQSLLNDIPADIPVEPISPENSEAVRFFTEKKANKAELSPTVARLYNRYVGEEPISEAAQKFLDAPDKYARQNILIQNSSDPSLIASLNNSDGSMDGIAAALEGMANPARTYGEMDQLRSDILANLRTKNLSPTERKILSNIADEIRTAIYQSLPPEHAVRYELGKGLRGLEAEMFEKGKSRVDPIGAIFLDSKSKPVEKLNRALQGDVRAGEEITKVLDDDPTLIDQITRYVIDKKIKRDANDLVTYSKMRDFMDKQGPMLQQWMGKEEYQDLLTVMEDIRSAETIPEIAKQGAKRQSVTAPRMDFNQMMLERLNSPVAFRVSRWAGIVMRVLSGAAREQRARDIEAIKGLLFEAAMNPESAMATLATSPAPAMKSFRDRLGIVKGDIAHTATLAASGFSEEQQKKQNDISTFLDTLESQSGLSTQKKTEMAAPESISLIKEFEGFSPTAYKDQGGVWTLGYGQTGSIKPGDKVSKTEAEQMLTKEVDRVESAIDSLVQVPLSQSQRSALTSLIYNIGTGAFKNSTLLKVLNDGDYEEAAAQFLRWNKVKGETSQGLSSRRAKEAQLFAQGITETALV